MTRAIVALVFRCQATGGALTTSSETTQARWATRDEVTELADPAYAIRVLDALDLATPPAIRSHDGVHLTWSPEVFRGLLSESVSDRA